MPIDLAGISNENNFYSEHYLTTIFEGDIEETLRDWREAEKAGGSWKASQSRWIRQGNGGAGYCWCIA